MLHSINILLLMLFFKKLAPSIIWLYCSFTFKINYQLMLIVLATSLFYKNKINYIFIIKLTQTWKLNIFTKLINKSLFFNKIAHFHIILYTISIILSFITVRSNVTRFNTFTIIVTLILGCFWSFQEILWGGIWNWNLIEITILMWSIMSLLSIHNKKLTLYQWSITPLIIIMYVYFNHIPLTLSVHNFINNKYTKITYIVILTLIIYLTIFVKNILTLFILIIWLNNYIIIYLNINTMNYQLIIKILTVVFLINNLNMKNNLTDLAILNVNIIIYGIIKYTISMQYNYKNTIVNWLHKLIIVIVFQLVIVQSNYLLFYKYQIMPTFIKYTKYNYFKNLTNTYFNKNNIYFILNKNIGRKNKLNLYWYNNYLFLKIICLTQ